MASMGPEEFAHLTKDDVRWEVYEELWNALGREGQAVVCAYWSDREEIERDADCLANGIDPAEIAPRRKAIDDLCSAARGLGAADDLCEAICDELEGRGVAERTESVLAEFRESVRAFEAVLGRALTFNAEGETA